MDIRLLKVDIFCYLDQFTTIWDSEETVIHSKHRIVIIRLLKTYIGHTFHHQGLSTTISDSEEIIGQHIYWSVDIWILKRNLGHMVQYLDQSPT